MSCATLQVAQTPQQRHARCLAICHSKLLRRQFHQGKHACHAWSLASCRSKLMRRRFCRGSSKLMRRQFRRGKHVCLSMVQTESHQDCSPTVVPRRRNVNPLAWSRASKIRHAALQDRRPPPRNYIKEVTKCLQDHHQRKLCLHCTERDAHKGVRGVLVAWVLCLQNPFFGKQLLSQPSWLSLRPKAAVEAPGRQFGSLPVAAAPCHHHGKSSASDWHPWHETPAQSKR